eukprot:9139012-Pyramimonas_sp.AAC.1
MSPGTSSLRSRSVRSGLGCKRGLDPQRYRAQFAAWHIAIQHGAAQHSAQHGTSRSIQSALHLAVAQSGAFEALPRLTFLYSFPGSWVDHVLSSASNPRE